MKIEVIKEDFAKAYNKYVYEEENFLYSRDCPIAQAVRRQLPELSREEISIGPNIIIGDFMVHASAYVMQFMNNWDAEPKDHGDELVFEIPYDEPQGTVEP